ncbi:MAG: 2-amino-4-hydroxy-6-hydroxymethyldihydropteridine diphosphokinase [Deltaproteobacteria bacterium]|nr:2-amino-4-hydroxy-6-hydroxymethyldihydropteridine diphosphokinase [Deltaproteobacteria bacterium]
MTTKAYIGFGSNMGDLFQNFKNAKEKLARHEHISSLNCSSLYLSQAHTIDDQAQPDYLNAVFEITTSLTLHELFHYTQAIERNMGRTRRKKWAPRKVDLDILFYGDAVYQDEEITVPHPEIPRRRFVIKPLLDLNAGLIHPDLELSLKDLWDHSPDQTALQLFTRAEQGQGELSNA